MEEWRWYVENHYQVSNRGRIRSVDKPVIFSGTLGIRKGIVLTATRNSKGYPTVVICVNGTRKTISVHQAVAAAFLENPENKPQVNHIDGDPFNNFVENLEWVTAGENQQHAYDTGLAKRGSAAKQALLTEQQVLDIRDLFEQGVSQSKLAEVFEVTKSCIKQITRRNTWKHI